MINTDNLVKGRQYSVMANDIVSQWRVVLTWTGDDWSHESENVDGRYPAIVHDIICEVDR